MVYMYNVIIIGGGAAGMMAAYSAKDNNNNVILLEKNEKLGKKIYITGKGRCNLTNDISVQDYVKNVISNPKFTYACLSAFSPFDTQNFFTEHGLKLKVERGGRVFPQSDKASDVTKTLERAIISKGVEIRLNTKVCEIIVDNNRVLGVKTADGQIISAEYVIICTGGVSYPLTGSTGDGYNFAKSVGHTIIPLKPALTGIELQGDTFLQMQGLSLKNVNVSVFCGNKRVYSKFGEMLFTHFGVSGPIILSCSSVINRLDFSALKLIIDLKPALDENVLDNRLLREFAGNQNKTLSTVMRALLPQSLILPILQAAVIRSDKKCAEITKEERKRLLYALKNFTFSIKGLRSIEEGIVTAGGVNVKEIDPKTMQSKLVSGLFFAGEVLDIDCFTGGFNLQAAFSTGYLAGLNCRNAL